MREIMIRIGIVLFTAACFVTMRCERNVPAPTMFEIVHVHRYDTLNVRNLIAYCEEIDVQFPRVAVAHSIIESGWMTSPLAVKNKNLFGMKLATRRHTTAIGSDRDGNAIYSNWRESVMDYKLWQDWHKEGISRLKTDQDYANYITTSGYGGDSNYVKLLSKIIF